MILGMTLALAAPAAVMAQQRGGGHGGGQSYSSRGGERGGYRGGDRGGYGYRGRVDRDDRFYRGGYGYYAAPYGYGYGYSYANPCSPAGYYDRWGRWIPSAGCYVSPYGY
jgi:hypothetical protein